MRGIAVRSLIAGLAAVGFLAAAVDAGAQSTVYRATTRTLTDTTTITVPYATNGRTRTWTYGWSATGQLLSVDGPLAGTGDTTSYGYNALGYLQTVTDPLGHVTTVTTWNSRGQPTTVVDPNGVTTILTYDIHDRILTVTADPGATQSQYAFEYNALGDVTKVTLPEGGWLSYTYDDGRRLTGVSNDRGETQTFAVNGEGNPTAVTVKTSGGVITRQQTFAYDELGRLLQAIGAGSQTTGFGYDKTDNLTSVTDARSKLWTQAFDGLNRLKSQTNPQSQSVQLAYSPQDQLNSHKDGRLLETTRVIDGFGQVIREVSPDRGTLTYWYDAAGNVTKRIDGDGQETDYSYDNASRPTGATFVGASGEAITYSYDSTAGGNHGVGRLTGVTEESGSSALTYDAQGRITGDTKLIQGKTYPVQYAYDRNGLVTQITLPSGRTVSYSRAADGLITGVTTKTTPSSSVDTLASAATYLPFGPLQGLTYGNGLSLVRTFDQNEWLSRIEVKASGVTSLDLSYGRNDNGQLTGVTDNISSGRGASFTYTDAGRLLTANGPWGNETYAYDAAGNRTDKQKQVGATITHETPVVQSASNRIDSVTDGASTTLRTLTWRAGGDLSRAVFSSGPTTWDYVYNARKRLKELKVGGVAAVDFGYDFRGLRVWSQVLGATPHHSHFIFDEAGHVLAEHDGDTGAVIREFIWLDDMLLALIDSSAGPAATYFVHTGPLGEPLQMTDGSKTSVWDAYVEPYGQAQVLSSSVGNPIRLPGQWEEPEATDLAQNWHRNYDPTLGRYVQADPLGIEAGQNVYAYVDGDPLGKVDPRGLGPTGALVGGGIGVVLTGLGSLGVDVSTGGLNILATPGELSAGALTGAAVGSRVEDLIASMSHSSGTTIQSRTQTDNCPDKTCPPCRPFPAGTIGYLGPHTDHDHYPIGRPHLNLFSVNQNKTSCRCFWNKANPDAAAPPPLPGWVDLNSGFPKLSP